MRPLAQMLIQEYLAALRPGGGLDETDFNASLFRPVKKQQYRHAGEAL
jgi:hypothetical protein